MQSRGGTHYLEDISVLETSRRHLCSPSSGVSVLPSRIPPPLGAISKIQAAQNDPRRGGKSEKERRASRAALETPPRNLAKPPLARPGVIPFRVLECTARILREKWFPKVGRTGTWKEDRRG
ncbi:hypothetical protein KM043_016235 [Ampulex compressa]|nr:hypothetical protein KM043_016235 [Ampulex compressa]